MKRYEPQEHVDWLRKDHVRSPMETVENGEYLSLTEVIEFIRAKDPSLLTDFYAEIDVKRVQR